MKKIILLFLIIFQVAVIVSASSDKSVVIYGWPISGELTETDSGYILSRPAINIDRTYRLMDIILDKNMQPADPDGLVLAGSTYIEAENGFYCSVDKYVLKPDGPFGAGLYIDGELRFLGNGELKDFGLHSREASFYLGIDRKIHINEKGYEKINFMGFDFSAGRICSYNTLDSTSGYFVIESLGFPGSENMSEKSLVIPEIIFTADGKLVSMSRAENGEFINNTWKVKSEATFLTEDGLSINGWFEFCEGLPGQVFYGKGLSGAGDGYALSSFSFSPDPNVRKVNFEFGKYGGYGFYEHSVYDSVDSGVWLIKRFRDMEQLVLYDGDKQYPVRMDYLEMDQNSAFSSWAVHGSEEYRFEIMGISFLPWKLTFQDRNLFISGTCDYADEYPEADFTLVYNTLGYIDEIIVTTMAEGEKSVYKADPDPEYQLVDALDKKDTDFLDRWNREGRSADLKINTVPVIVHRAMENDVWAVQWLLDNGADINVLYKGGTALTFAAGQGNTELIQLLLNNGADPLVFTGGENNPLAAALGRKNSEAADLLLEYSCDFEDTGDSDNTMYDYLIKTLDPVLIKKGINAGIKTESGGRTEHPFILLTKQNDYIGKLGFFNSLGYNAVQQGKNGKEVFLDCFERAEQQYIIDLLPYVPEDQLQGEKYSLLLPECVKRNYLDLFSELIKAGVSPDSADRKGMTALDYLNIIKNTELLSLLDEYSRDIPAAESGAAFFKFDNIINMQMPYIHSVSWDGISETFSALIVSEVKQYSGFSRVSVHDISLNNLDYDKPHDLGIVTDKNSLFLYAGKDGFIFAGNRINMGTLSGVDGSVSFYSHDGRLEKELVLTTEDNDFLIDLYRPDDISSGESLALVRNVRQNEDVLYLVPFGKDRKVNYTIPVKYDGLLIDGAACSSEEGYYLFTILKQEDKHILHGEIRTRQNRQEAVFSIEIPPSDNIQLTGSQDGSFIIGLERLDNSDIDVYQINESFTINEYFSIDIPLLHDFRIMKHENDYLIIASRGIKYKRESGRDKTDVPPNIWLIEFEEKEIPRGAFMILLEDEQNPLNFSSCRTMNNGLLIAVCSKTGINLVQLNEKLKGVPGKYITFDEFYDNFHDEDYDYFYGD